MLAPGSSGSAALGDPHCSSPGFIRGLPLPQSAAGFGVCVSNPSRDGTLAEGNSLDLLSQKGNSPVTWCDPSSARPQLPGLWISLVSFGMAPSPPLAEGDGCKLQGQGRKTSPLGFRKSFMASSSSPGRGLWKPETSVPPSPEFFCNTPLPGAILGYFFSPQWLAGQKLLLSMELFSAASGSQSC